jgi:serine/threonine-protein kinase HipA
MLVENNEGMYIFTYDENYNKEPVSLTLPVRKKIYESKIIFPFFDGLIPEGWMLNIASKNWKVNIADRMGLLLACCNDCIGCVRIEEDE